MATVFIGRAVEEDGTEDLVALKVIRDELAGDERFHHMFVDEAKILARLSHPNVIQTREHGVTGDHRFIAMELLSGRTYADVWDALASKGERMPLRLGAWICARVAAGVHSAHELVDDSGQPLNVIHRDVNPSNIFLTHAGAVKLIDFGLAKARVRSAQSVDGIVKGKIPYLAPEQAHGRSIDRRIDVYAIGATLWETATMKRLFKRDTDVATLLAIRDAKIPDLREQVEGFPDELWAIVERATKEDVDARCATAEELRRDLDAWIGEADAMAGELSALLARLFPGQEQKLASWARAATSTKLAAFTMRPPVPVPTASSTLLDEDDFESVEQAPAEQEAKDEKDEAEQDEEAAESPEPPPEPPLSDAARPSQRVPDRRDGAEPDLDRAADPEGVRRLWVSAAVVVAVLVALFLMFGSR